MIRLQFGSYDWQGQCQCQCLGSSTAILAYTSLLLLVQANINLNFLYFLMATATCGAVPPLAASITWAKTSKFAAITCKSCGITLSCCASLYVNGQITWTRPFLYCCRLAAWHAHLMKVSIAFSEHDALHHLLFCERHLSVWDDVSHSSSCCAPS